MINILLVIYMISFAVYAFKKTIIKRKAIFIFLLVIVLTYSIKAFGISPSPRLTHNITNNSDYKYLENYKITDEKVIFISKLTSTNDLPKYNLKPYNNRLGLYFKNYKHFEKSITLTLENKDFEIVCIKFNQKYYYLVDFLVSDITYLEINGVEIIQTEIPYCIFELDEEIKTIKIDDYTPTWYTVSIPI